VQRALILVVLVGCQFTGRPVDGDDVPTPDAEVPDGLPSICGEPGDTGCDGRIRKHCGPDHQWDEAMNEVCDFTCVAGTCVDASNVGAAAVAACEGIDARPLTPVSGSVTITEPLINQIKLICSDGCGGEDEIDAIRIPGTPGTPGVAWFCLSTVDIPAGVPIRVPPSGGPSESIIFVVDGSVAIAGALGFDGFPGNGTMAGEGAPGGDDGAPHTAVVGLPGGGTCGGSGGARAGGAGDLAAGAGGGGGYATIGGAGGDGRNPNDSFSATGGGGGGVCGTEDLVPLVGGSGGGGGSDGTCGSDCGWPGGGGGGAIQISSRVSIAISGTIRARGGDGYGVDATASGEGGGGGGGAGGAILLEAPAISVSGALVVDGGDGGASLAGAGGAGATALTGPTAGASGDSNSEGGAGGGGSGGRIRIRAGTPTCPATASPVASCTVAVMP
jgi:hypothetical protein